MSNPKRRWFQIHLSTAVVLMFVAGGLLMFNLRPSLREHVLDATVKLDHGGYHGGSLKSDVTTWEWGWPFVFWENHTYGEKSIGDRVFWDMTALFANLVLSFALLAILIVVLEGRIRRREARKP
jgi:hypothetical protein